MHFLSILLLSLLLVACGKDGGSSSSSSDRQEEQERYNRGYLEANRIGETDLLNVTLGADAEVTDGRITFRRGATMTNSGQKSTCSFTINAGDIWNLQRSGSSLRVQLPDGKNLTFQSVNAENSIYGSWYWKGQEGSSRIQRRLSIIPGRVLFNQDCES